MAIIRMLNSQSIVLLSHDPARDVVSARDEWRLLTLICVLVHQALHQFHTNLVLFLGHQLLEVGVSYWCPSSRFRWNELPIWITFI